MRTQEKLIALVLLAMPSIAFGYLDPGTLAMLWQLLAGVVVGTIVFGKRIFFFVKRVLSKKVPAESAQAQRIEKEHPEEEETRRVING